MIPEDTYKINSPGHIVSKPWNYILHNGANQWREFISQLNLEIFSVINLRQQQLNILIYISFTYEKQHVKCDTNTCSILSTLKITSFGWKTSITWKTSFPQMGHWKSILCSRLNLDTILYILSLDGGGCSPWDY